MLKHVKDNFVKLLSGSNFIPEGVLDASEYFRHFGAIHFEYKEEDGLTIATSTNFKWGTIIASGKNADELDCSVRDAILTAFSVPSVYSKKLNIQKVGSRRKEYALA